MKIKSITIENFRSYYESNSFEIGSGLTLIIGDNGDGKTTFFEALEWLFDTSNARLKMDSKYISAKRMSEIIPGETASVRVSMTFDHEGEKIVEKSFSFYRGEDGEIRLSNYQFAGYEQNGSERRMIAGEVLLDRYFEASIRRYCLFKGERELNIFNKAEAMKYLVDTFSNIREFDPYVQFVEFAEDLSSKATDNAMRADKKNSNESKRLQNSIEEERRRISELKDELRTKNKEASDFTQLLQDIERNKEASEVLKSINDRLQTLKGKRSKTQSTIKENYTIRLLDDMWILCGFAPILKEYTAKISAVSKLRRKEENEYNKQLGAKNAVENIQKQLAEGIMPLPLHAPDAKTMQEMLDDEFCKVCGRPAPKGTEAYEFMQQKLHDFCESIKPRNEEKSLFSSNYITELDKRETVLANDLDAILGIRKMMEEDIEFNRCRKEELKKIDDNILEEEEKKRKLLAQTDGVDESALINAYENITNWWNLRKNAEVRAENLTLQLKTHEETLEKHLQEYHKLAGNSPAAMYSRTSNVLRKISQSFNNAKIRNKREFLTHLEEVANEYLDKLNNGDFKGIIRIMESPDGTAKTYLYDKNENKISHPNTALNTTMYMSILFAISKLTTLKRENDYPLIFDAPTSSFAVAKEADFFNVIGDIDKQSIIVTKSFLMQSPSGRNELDYERISTLHGTVYRIEKNKSFDPQDLSSIQTVISKIK